MISHGMVRKKVRTFSEGETNVNNEAVRKRQRVKLNEGTVLLGLAGDTEM